MTNESNAPKKRGCFFYGCLSLVALGLVGLVFLGVAFWVVKNQTERWIQEYTEATPVLLERVEYPPDRMNALYDRLAAFKERLDKGGPAGELVLTADDLNALIANEARMRDKLFVRIDNDEVKGDVSWPLENLGPFKLKGRYLNGTATFKAALKDGTLDVRVQEVQVKGKPLPRSLLAEIKKHNLAQEYQKDPRAAKDISRFESILVTNGQVVLRTKEGQR